MIALRPGESLQAGQSVAGAGFVLANQGDGNVVLYRNGHPVWATNMFGPPGPFSMQGDGNLVQYHGDQPVWATMTFSPGSQLELTSAGLKVTAFVDVWTSGKLNEPEQPPVPPVGPVSPTYLDGPRAVRDDSGFKLHVGPSRFYWLWAMKHDPDRVFREMDSDVAVGATYARVLMQVGDPNDPRDYWAGRIADPAWPDHDAVSRRLFAAAQERGLRILATIIGKGGAMNAQSERRRFVERQALIMRDYRAAVLCAEMMNEPDAGGRITAPELHELDAIFRQVTGGQILSATGAVWSAGGATLFDPEMWRITQGQVGICHLDRDTTKSEMQDRPWRQGWDTGLEGRAWIDNEHIGPGASVAVEDRPLVLRSHRTVAFICRAFASCYHADPGIRGNGDLAAAPGYREFSAATRFLPGDLPNGNQINANAGFANRHWNIAEGDLRAENGNRRGIVRCYGVQHGGFQYTVPFGPVTDFELVAERNIVVECFQQDVNDRLWERQVDAGERVRFSAQHPDYLLKSRAL